MDRTLLPHLPVVVAVARTGGFASAAAALGIGASAVSHAVRFVEDRLGEPLFARTTRSVSLTEAGARFVAAVEPALDDIDAAAEALSAARGEVTGLLRLNAPRVAVSMALAPILARLAREHPRLAVELRTDDGFVDIVAQGFDAGVRLGGSIGPDMVATRLTPPFRAVAVASPRYLAERSVPRTLDDLAAHNCIGFRMLGSGALYAWEFEQDGKTIAVETRGTAVLTDATFAPELALAGVGIAYAFEPLVRAPLGAGQLVRVLPEAAVEEDGLFLYYPRRASLAPKLRAFIGAAKAVREGR